MPDRFPEAQGSALSGKPFLRHIAARLGGSAMQSAAQSLTAGDMILRFAFTMKHAISLRPTNTGASLKNRKQSRPRSLQAAARNPPHPLTGKGLYHLSPRPSSRLSGWSSVLNRELRFRFFSFPTTPAGVFVGHNSRSRRRPRVAKQSRTVYESRTAFIGEAARAHSTTT